jgi:sulfur-oxidizing protein SoxX
LRTAAPLARWSCAAACALLAGCATSSDAPRPLVAATGADAMPAPLTAQPGNAESGRRIVADRQVGLCLLCHSAPMPELRFQGELGTDLAGAGARWSEGQLRQRLVNPASFNPQTIMPAYYRTEGLSRVGAAWRDKTVLDAQQIEDVVAYLRTLRAAR